FRRLIEIAQGDYSPDEYRKRFPKFEGADTGDTPTQLFEKWVSERKPAQGTIENWQYFFAAMTERFKGRSAGSIMPDEAQDWIIGLANPTRSARTVNFTWLKAAKRIFKWAAKRKYIPRNPFVDAEITYPKKIKLRETQALLPGEQRLILKAATEVTDTNTPDTAARRWVPWLMAYTGARVGEITQLRKKDVIERDGINALRFTPDAGTVKTGRARVVPLHEHLIVQKFL